MASFITDATYGVSLEPEVLEPEVVLEEEAPTTRRVVLGPPQIAGVGFVAFLFLAGCCSLSYLAGMSRPVAATSKAVVTTPAAAPLVIPSVAPAPLFGGGRDDAPPVSPGTYLQVGVVLKTTADVFAAGLREDGLKPVAAPGPDDTSVRMLVGPFPNAASLGSAQAILDRNGLQSFAKVF